MALMEVSFKHLSIGRIAVLLAMAETDRQADELAARLREMGHPCLIGKVGSMDVEKIVAAIVTAVKRERLTDDTYRSEHGVYHACVEALHGICRGSLTIGGILRTVGLRFAVVAGPHLECSKADRDQWVAVALYGMIGAPIKGREHEVIGLGINPL